MSRAKKIEKKSKEIQRVTTAPSVGLLVQTAETSFNNAFTAFAAALSHELTPKVLVPVFMSLKLAEDNLEDLKVNVRNRMLAFILQNGKVATETGTKRVETDGWLLEARPQKTGVDAKKLEAALRARDLPVEKYMTATVTYSVDEEGIGKLLGEGKLTKDELETCKHEVKFNVQRPKRVQEMEPEDG